MSAQNRIEEFALAPDDARWGDERARDEYYRGVTVAFWWMQYFIPVVMVVAAAQGAILASWLALGAYLAAGIAAWRYGRRRGIRIDPLGRELSSGHRWLALAVLVPLYLLWIVMNLLPFDLPESVPDVIGGLIGAVIGVTVLTVVMRRRERRDAQRLAAEDDTFE
ncbi:hypothetical protein P0W64_19860 [Tsukamurella sp. 8F]|uniref:hypothetical protein n=1 Tax=unclassified Tsukamurella TaxID=2633480 RepID=UPI0023B9C526|nr:MULTISPECIES: hypothetical protein [unclassified Tsukamurella]MDF0531802.1 hypothetical protein [Tsukamurella sp. 8J]MDF0589044.1 hypothetical protein [Tsukamurella sp. 8F]